ncbi:NAD(P)/FAD-dependent oxidoreductase [Haloechinothrix salitolerans]|uniref:NAD(P)/FAD-dependent oxidoreductase n=1 Tax=Haloechinothrix salitolerans TaxID=926830 RepID=A0ABW2C3A2_9PSEU
MSRQRVAVIGAGVSGLTAAYLLQRRYDVLLFEADDRLGGHAHTHDVATSEGTQLAVDSGFIVHNERTYPNLLRLFGELGVATQDSEMSMSVRCDGCGLEYAGGRGVGGVTAQPRALLRSAYLRMLTELPRFHRAAHAVLAAEDDGTTTTLGEFLRAGGYSRYFADHMLLPLISAVWSADLRTCLDYPARYLFRFLDHHGMLSVTGSPTWRTVTGGSRTYVERAVKNLTAVRTSTPVRVVSRHSGGATVRDEAGETHDVDKVVIATHADQALSLLADPTDDERRVLGAFGYSVNETWLHADDSVLPNAPKARASWNYLKLGCHVTPEKVLISYDMNRLMNLSTSDQHVVTLNATDFVDRRGVRYLDDSSVIARMTYEHPIYTPGSVAAQAELPSLRTATTTYAGAYHGWGFHEDGCASGVAAAEAFGVSWA